MVTLNHHVGVTLVDFDCWIVVRLLFCRRKLVHEETCSVIVSRAVATAPPLQEVYEKHWVAASGMVFGVVCSELRLLPESTLE